MWGFLRLTPITVYILYMHVYMCVCSNYVMLSFYLSTDTDKPTNRLLLQYVRNEVASRWRDLGTLLLEEESVSELNIIKANHPDDVKECCREVFELWLRKDPEPNWNTLIDALKQIGQNALVAKIKRDVLKGSCIVI